MHPQILGTGQPEWKSCSAGLGQLSLPRTQDWVTALLTSGKIGHIETELEEKVRTKHLVGGSSPCSQFVDDPKCPKCRLIFWP